MSHNDILNPSDWTLHQWQGPFRNSPDVIALHGFTGTGTDFQSIATHPDNPFSNWIAPDLPGHGQTGRKAPNHIPSFASTDEGIQYLVRKSARPPILLGYSMGGRLALHYAINHPENISALILISATPGIADPILRNKRQSQDAQRAQFIRLNGSKAFAEQWEKEIILQSQSTIPIEIKAKLQANRRVHSKTGLANALQELGTGSMPNLWPRLTNLKNLPILLLTGNNDTKFSKLAENMRTDLNNAEHSKVDNAGHTPHLEKRLAFIQSLCDFSAIVTHQNS